MLTSHLYSRTLTVMCVAAPFDTVEITNGYGYELTAVPCLPTITRPGHRCASYQLCRARSSPASMFVRVCQSELLSVWRRTPREKKKRRPGEIGARPFCNNGGLSYKMAAPAKNTKEPSWRPHGGTWRRTGRTSTVLVHADPDAERQHPLYASSMECPCLSVAATGIASRPTLGDRLRQHWGSKSGYGCDMCDGDG